MYIMCAILNDIKIVQDVINSHDADVFVCELIILLNNEVQTIVSRYITKMIFKT